MPEQIQVVDAVRASQQRGHFRAGAGFRRAPINTVSASSTSSIRPASASAGTSQTDPIMFGLSNEADMRPGA